MSKCKCCGEEIGVVSVCPICGAAHEVPQPVYVAPQPVYVTPQPVYVTSQPHEEQPQVEASAFVPQQENPTQSASWENLFCSRDWKANWKNFRKKDSVGIILTNTSSLRISSQFDSALADFVNTKSTNGVDYCLLDISTQDVCKCSADCEEIVDLLTTIYAVAVPDYLLIVGDDSVIPSIEWDNESADDDETVPSDLPYITLDTDSPWNGNEYDFDSITQVGRIPTKAEHHFKEAVAYLKNAVEYESYLKAKAFVYSAKEWIITTKEEFAPISPYIITSPDYTSDKKTAQSRGLKLIAGINDDYNLLCFNLHGSEASHKWFGQLGSFLPIALEGSVLTKDRKSPFAVCTEACYGARPKIKVNGEESVVVHALSNKCIAFVGSTRIAYGCVSGGMCCADVIANSFTKTVAGGATFGEAFLRALSDLSNKARMDEEEIKTLAEFGLYGDPSARLVSGAKTKGFFANKSLTVSKTRKNQALGITLMSCDNFGYVGRANKSAGTIKGFSEMEKIQIKKMASNIRVMGKNALKSANIAISDVDPKVFKVVGGEGYRAVYSKMESNVKTIVKLHMDDNGNVKKIYTSK